MAESGVEYIRTAAFTEVGILKLQWSRFSSNKDLAAELLARDSAQLDSLILTAEITAILKILKNSFCHWSHYRYSPPSPDPDSTEQAVVVH